MVVSPSAIYGPDWAGNSLDLNASQLVPVKFRPLNTRALHCLYPHGVHHTDTSGSAFNYFLTSPLSVLTPYLCSLCMSHSIACSIQASHAYVKVGITILTTFSFVFYVNSFCPSTVLPTQTSVTLFLSLLHFSILILHHY